MKIVCKEEKHVSYSTECKIEDFCCRMMKKVLDRDYMKTYKDGSGNLYPTFELDECGIKIPIRLSSYGGTKDEYIKYCPFCGEEIE